jgi:hypothetical protein
MKSHGFIPRIGAGDGGGVSWIGGMLTGVYLLCGGGGVTFADASPLVVVSISILSLPSSSWCERNMRRMSWPWSGFVLWKLSVSLSSVLSVYDYRCAVVQSMRTREEKTETPSFPCEDSHYDAHYLCHWNFVRVIHFESPYWYCTIRTVSWQFWSVTRDIFDINRTLIGFCTPF